MQSVVNDVLKIIISILLLFNTNDVKKPQENKEKEIMELIIEKINLDNKIYSKNSKLNNIDKNVVILEESNYPDEEDSTVLLGAHSGVGKEAYFNNLIKLQVNDKIKLKYKNKYYIYEIYNIRKDNKDGKITIDYTNKEKRLVLYTCHPNDKNSYLIVSSRLTS